MYGPVGERLNWSPPRHLHVSSSNSCPEVAIKTELEAAGFTVLKEKQMTLTEERAKEFYRRDRVSMLLCMIWALEPPSTLPSGKTQTNQRGCLGRWCGWKVPANGLCVLADPLDLVLELPVRLRRGVWKQEGSPLRAVHFEYE